MTTQVDLERYTHPVKERRSGIAASQVAAVMGEDKYRDVYDVMSEKLGKTEPFPGNNATAWGNYLEDAIIDRWLQDGDRETRQVTVYSEAHPVLLAIVDAVIHPAEGNPYVLEVKTTGAATGELPEAWRLQAMVGAHCAGVDYAVVLIATVPQWTRDLPPTDVVAPLKVAEEATLTYHTVPVDPEEIERIAARCEEVWTRYIVNREPLPFPIMRAKNAAKKVDLPLAMPELDAVGQRIVQLERTAKAYLAEAKNERAKFTELAAEIQNGSGTGYSFHFNGGGKQSIKTSWKATCAALFTSLSQLIGAQCASTVYGDILQRNQEVKISPGYVVIKPAKEAAEDYHAPTALPMEDDLDGW
jgi:hypothetical protein